MITYTLNEKLNGIEISFSSVPCAEIRNTMKEHGFRWHNQKKVWYAKQTDARLLFAEHLTDTKADTKTVAKTEKGNKYGVQIGDIFESSWGYEQTNNTFFQVVALVGESSVRVREVMPKLIKTDSESWASGNYTYDINREILPPITRSTFIKDQEKGDLKRLKSYRQDGTRPEFKISTFANAHYVEPGQQTFFSSSWY